MFRQEYNPNGRNFLTRGTMERIRVSCGYPKITSIMLRNA